MKMSVVGLASDILELINREIVRSYAFTDILKLVNRESVRIEASFGHFEACKSSKCPKWQFGVGFLFNRKQII